MATKEERINKEITTLYERFEHSLPSKSSTVRKSVGNVLLDVYDILARYTNDKGVIPRKDIPIVVEKIEALDKRFYHTFRTSLSDEVESSAKFMTAGLITALILVFGIDALIKLHKLPTAIAKIPIGTADVVFSAIVNKPVADFISSVQSSTFSRKEEDGKTLVNRLDSFATTLTNKLSKIVREDVKAELQTTDIIKHVKKALRDEGWKIDTLVETESLYAIRKVLAEFADESDMVSALKIIDFPHGSIAVHKTHKCYIYANSNEHGLGKGVYPTSTRKIRNPHPRCRSVLVFVLKGGN